VILALLAVLIVLFVVLPLIGLALWALLSTIVVGLIIGGLARLVIPGSQPIGFLATVMSGLSGSLIGGFLGQHAFHIGYLGTVLLEVAIAAAMVAVLAYRGGRSISRPRV
jgi:uncharacterized membrane protein YeaQ/YmgE (transglycosylase-associated protein family)